MEKIRQCFLLFVLSPSFAQLTCNDLPGVWWGQMSDKTHLMLEESVPVLFSVERKENQYIGQFKLMYDVPGISSRI